MRSFKALFQFLHLDDLPANEPDEVREERLKQYVGCRLRLKVIECDSKRGRIVLSERAAQTEPDKRQKLLNSLVVGSMIPGKVTQRDRVWRIC